METPFLVWFVAFEVIENNCWVWQETRQIDETFECDINIVHKSKDLI